MDKLLGELFDDKLLKIIKFFLMNKDKEFYLQEISKQAGVPIATVFRTIKKLKELVVSQLWQRVVALMYSVYTIIEIGCRRRGLYMLLL